MGEQLDALALPGVPALVFVGEPGVPNGIYCAEHDPTGETP